MNRDERDAYFMGRTAMEFGDFRHDKYPGNPYNDLKSPTLFTAWEIGFNDALDEQIEIDNGINDIIKDLRDDEDR